MVIKVSHPHVVSEYANFSSVPKSNISIIPEVWKYYITVTAPTDVIILYPHSRRQLKYSGLHCNTRMLFVLKDSYFIGASIALRVSTS